MPYCKYCGSAVDSDAVFCSECGKRLAPKAPPVPAAPRKTPVVEHVTTHGDAIPTEEITRTDPEKLQEYMDRVVSYRTAMSMLNEVYNRQDEWGDYDLEMWAELEATMRKKYDIPDNSTFRFLRPERREKLQPQSERRNTRRYTKKDTEYWQQFERKNEGDE